MTFQVKSDGETIRRESVIFVLDLNEAQFLLSHCGLNQARQMQTIYAKIERCVKAQHG